MLKMMSIVIGTQPRNFMQTLYSLFDLMIIHRFTAKHNSIIDLDTFLLIRNKIY